MVPRRLILGGALAMPSIARAQAWPTDRPADVIVPFPAGGGVDAMARLIMPMVAARVPPGR